MKARLVTLMALVVTSSLFASTAGAAPHGGSGGAPFTVSCGADEVLAGIKVRSGALVDAVEALCVKVGPNGTWSGGHSGRGAAGGAGGAPATLLCPSGSAVTGIHGRSGALVDSLGTQCKPLLGSGGTTTQGPVGGGGGAAFGVDACPGGQVGKGLRGRAGTLIDQIDLVCGAVPAQAAAAPSAVAPPVAARSLGSQAPSGTAGSAPPPIKIEATTLSVSPTSSYEGIYVNRFLTVRFTMRNTGSATVERIPWSIHNYSRNATLASGELPSLAPNAEAAVTASWKPTEPGTYKIQGYVDPTGRALKNTVSVDKQVKERDLEVPAKILQWDLKSTDWSNAVQLAPDETGRLCQRSVTDESYIPGGPPGSGGRYGTTVVVKLDCTGLLTGGRVTIDAFKDVQLKNGWKVVSATAWWSGGSKATVTELQKPGAGATNPYLRARIAVDANNTGHAHIQVVVEGPDHAWYK